MTCWSIWNRFQECESPISPEEEDAFVSPLVKLLIQATTKREMCVSGDILWSTSDCALWYDLVFSRARKRSTILNNEIWCLRCGKWFVNKDFPVSDTQMPLEQNKTNKWFMMAIKTHEQKVWECTHHLVWPSSWGEIDGDCHRRLAAPFSAAWLTLAWVKHFPNALGLLSERPERSQ